jgi:hypothetical protein
LDVVSGDLIAFWSGTTKVASLNAASGLTGLATPLAVAEGGTGGTAFALSALSDVSVTENFSENNTALIYNAGSVNKWQQTPFKLSSLTDVNVVTNTNYDDVLMWSSADEWIQSPLTVETLQDYPDFTYWGYRATRTR